MMCSIDMESDKLSLRRAAYAEIVRANEAALMRAARRMSPGDEDRAQDLVQDAVVRGYEAFVRGGFREGTNAKAWLLRILTNGFINEFNRRRKWEVQTPVSEEGSESFFERLPAESGSQPESALLSTTLDEPLERALAALSPEFRLCVLLVDVEGLEYSEAATALKIPIGTVRSRLARARLQLHGLLYEYARARGRV